MTECAFHPDNHATAELGVTDPLVGRVTIPICDDCVDAYDEIQQEYLEAMNDAESEDHTATDTNA